MQYRLVQNKAYKSGKVYTVYLKEPQPRGIRLRNANACEIELWNRVQELEAEMAKMRLSANATIEKGLL